MPTKIPVNLMAPPTSVWGPHGWRFLHYVSLGYPENPTDDDKDNYKQFYYMIRNVLPCSLCSYHYKENYERMPLTDEILSDKSKLVRWVIDIHNIVNESKNKRIIPYDEAIELIKTDVECKPVKHSESKKENTLYDILPMLGILGILIIIAIAYKKK